MIQEIEKETLSQALETIRSYYFNKKDFISYGQIGRAIDVIDDYDGEMPKATATLSQSLRAFIDDVEYMQRLYTNQKYTKAEEWRDKLAERLDDLMRETSD